MCFYFHVRYFDLKKIIRGSKIIVIENLAKKKKFIDLPEEVPYMTNTYSTTP